VRLRLAGAHEIRRATRDDPRFAGSCARQNQERTVDVKDCFALFGVQGGQKIHLEA
jgi:hypothetical protein